MAILPLKEGNFCIVLTCHSCFLLTYSAIHLYGTRLSPTWAPFPDNDGSKLVRSFLRWIFRCIVKFFRAFPETPLNMNARALLLRRRRFVPVH